MPSDTADTLVMRHKLSGISTYGHVALKNEAAYARHYKYMATMPLLHYTHLPLGESLNTYSTD